MSLKPINYNLLVRNPNIIEKLNASLSTPSVFHSYSVITEYIKNLFIKRMGGLFTDKNIHIDAKHPFDDIRHMTITELMKKDSPVCSITPKINMEYHRDFSDTHMYGMDHFIKRGRLENCLLKDYIRNIFVGSMMEQLFLSYSFIIKVETRGQQLDLYKYLTVAFPFEHIMEDEVDMDYHLPYSMMQQFAVDAGYELDDNGNIKNVIGFVNYLNSISRLPVIYKFRTVNGHMEFFMRFNQLDILLKFPNMPNPDEGERKGQLQKNYRIEFDIEVYAPSVKMYIYYSSNAHEYIKGIITEDTDKNCIIYPVYTIEMTKIPKVNDRGWTQYILSEYYEDNIDDYVNIPFRELLHGNLEMDRVFDECKKSGVSPNNFIEFKIYNGGYIELPFDIDWDNMIIRFNQLVENNISVISVYIDTEYIHQRLISIDNMDKYNSSRYKNKR